MKNLEFFKNLECFATRPFTLQSEEIRVMFLIAKEVKHIFLPIPGGVRSVYFDKNDKKILYGLILSRLLNEYDKTKREYIQLKKMLYKSSLDVKKSIRQDKRKKLSAFRRWNKSLKEYYFPVFAPFAIEESLDPKCRDLLVKEFNDKADKYFEIISSPSKLNDYQKMRLDIINLFLSKKINDKKIGRLVKKYGWYSEYSYSEKLLDKDYFYSELKKNDLNDAIEEKKKLILIKENKKRFSEIYKKICNNELKLISKIINDYVVIRTERVDVLKRAQVNIRHFYEWLSNELSKKTQDSWEYPVVLYLLNDEIYNFLENEIIPDYKEALERSKQEYVYYYDGRSMHLIYDKAMLKKLQGIINKIEISDEIRGTIAYKGNVKGVVKIVFGKKDLHEFREGQIFVAKTTIPEYTSAMKLAIAFVSDEGGITSHTAIIARELHKPCIVGTKIATRVFKDGDLVEVDANKGIVKKIR